MDKKTNLYAGGNLDRATDRRKDTPWLTARLASDDTRVAPIWRGQTLIVDSDAARPRLSALAGCAGALLAAELGVEEPALLGLDGDTAWFALDVSVLDSPEAHPALTGAGRFVELRSVGALLPATEAALAAYARGLIWWHQRHRFCGVCGHATAPAEGGHVRICGAPACAVHHFPRTDPAVIMLVHDGERCLLGRQPRFPPGLFSTLAGFVDPGESLEEAVAREVFEETGVRVADIRYHSSQPWPFPSSLMLGFYARAVSTAIRVQPEEMEEARWFERSHLRALGPGEVPLLPRADSISRRLINDWIAG